MVSTPACGYNLLSSARQQNAKEHNEKIRTQVVSLMGLCRGVGASAFFGFEFVKDVCRSEVALLHKERKSGDPVCDFPKDFRALAGVECCVIRRFKQDEPHVLLMFEYIECKVSNIVVRALIF